MREWTNTIRGPVPGSIVSTRGRVEPNPGQDRFQNMGGSSGLLPIVRHIHHIMVEKSGKMRRGGYGGPTPPYTSE